ncbi:hypothetical protein [Actinoplanes sp. NPDC051851]|uniref:hypothetical protein n=1 Tax=Actinoplanes sp. NPDC051851 TaxID=3154753 RepID=UPI0034127C5C
MRAKKSDAQAVPGSFYRHALATIQAAHPTEDPAWQREQARRVMTAAFRTRQKVLGAAAVSSAGPMFPHTSEDRALLKRDFDTGARVDGVTWHAASGAASAVDRVEVAQSRGIICIRRGESNNGPAMYLTLPDWYEFAKNLSESPSAVPLEELQPEAPRVLDERLRADRGEKLVATVEDVLTVA